MIQKKNRRGEIRTCENKYSPEDTKSNGNFKKQHALYKKHKQKKKKKQGKFNIA